MYYATENRLIIQEIYRKTMTSFVGISPVKKCKRSSGFTVNVHRREQERRYCWEISITE